MTTTPARNPAVWQKFHLAEGGRRRISALEATIKEKDDNKEGLLTSVDAEVAPLTIATHQLCLQHRCQGHAGY
ncbi:hypothetical protein Y1Q_0022641 [Alligator mississippiensis]|uniref:Uncharacterized protein n=1 Tax=Alligator mississippiensis TaxID=8496 RepID=A0A151PHD3_ALLMI|nr:hypothetical protein Y1Q_0022641 [Alligator mississippiensis]